MYLVDTDVLSAGAPTKSRPATELAEWMDRHSDDLYLSVITVAEVESGIAKSRREGATRKADHLAEWLDAILHLYGNRILKLDVTVARTLGQLLDLARGTGRTPGLADMVVAATAAVHGCTILTRNVRHFEGLGVLVEDPFSALPHDSAT